MLEDYEAVISEYNGQTKDGVTYEVIKIDMEKDKDAAKRYKVEVKGFPTLYTFYTVGDKQIANIFPYRTKNEIIKKLLRTILTKLFKLFSLKKFKFLIFFNFIL